MPTRERKARADKPPPAPDALVRERAGRYRSGDERFVVRQDGGQWFVTDSQQTNEFGLEMVLGPFATVALAREQMAVQREHPAGADHRPSVLPSTFARRTTGRPRRSTRVPEPTPEPEPRTEAAHSPSAGAEPNPGSEPPPEPPMPEYVPADWTSTGDERDLVANAVRTINDAWVSGHPELMRDVLDAGVVFVQPGFAVRESGREAAIAGYLDFVTQAAVARYDESDLSIDIAGHTAVASYRWRIAYAMDGKDHDEAGRDLFVFDRFGTRWKLVWRVLLPDPGEG